MNESQRSQAEIRMNRLVAISDRGDSQLTDAQLGHLRNVTTEMRKQFPNHPVSGTGVIALFAGPSGTGKTTAAQFLARELGSEVFRVDTAQVVSKYIGETEKNLSAIFEAGAAKGNPILFFDEADALFGKRSEVKDSHDRYANIEVNYLLQQAEAYRGLVIFGCSRQDCMDARHVVEFRD